MSINIQVAVDQTISDLRELVDAIKELSRDQRELLAIEANQVIQDMSDSDPDLDCDLFESVLVMNIMRCIANGEIVL